MRLDEIMLNAMNNPFDIVLAFKLVDYLHAFEGLRLRLEQFGDGWYCTFKKPEGVDRGWAAQKAKTPALAIAMAAVRALKITEQQKIK